MSTQKASARSASSVASSNPSSPRAGSGDRRVPRRLRAAVAAGYRWRLRRGRLGERRARRRASRRTWRRAATSSRTTGTSTRAMLSARALAVGPHDAGLAQPVAQRARHRERLGVERPAVEADAREGVLGRRAAPELEAAVEVAWSARAARPAELHEAAPDDPAPQRLAAADLGAPGPGASRRRRRRPRSARASSAATPARARSRRRSAAAARRGRRACPAAPSSPCRGCARCAGAGRARRRPAAATAAAVPSVLALSTTITSNGRGVARLEPVAQGGHGAGDARVPRCRRARRPRSRGGPRAIVWRGGDGSVHLATGKSVAAASARLRRSWRLPAPAPSAAATSSSAYPGGSEAPGAERSPPPVTARASTATCTAAAAAAPSTSPSCPPAAELHALYREMRDDHYLAEEAGRRAHRRAAAGPDRGGRPPSARRGRASAAGRGLRPRPAARRGAPRAATRCTGSSCRGPRPRHAREMLGLPVRGRRALRRLERGRARSR